METRGRVLIITADGFEDSELQVPRDALLADGMVVDIASLEPGPVEGKHGLRVNANLAVAEVDAAAYDLLLLPGGKAPAKLRQDVTVLELTRAFADKGKPIAAICHGPQILISAGLLRGRTATCYRTVAREMVKSGAHYVDEKVVVDNGFITARQPADLPAFVKAIEGRLGIGSG